MVTVSVNRYHDAERLIFVHNLGYPCFYYALELCLHLIKSVRLEVYELVALVLTVLSNKSAKVVDKFVIQPLLWVQLL